jgi:signal transduction histidine kinase
MHPDERPGAEERRRYMLDAPLATPREAREFRLLRKDGSVITAECSSMPIDFEGAPVVLTFIRDVTKRNEERAQLIQTDRMATIGTLAAGVAHEINNPLGYVMLNLEVFGRELDELVDAPDARTRVRERLAMLQEGTRHIASIVRDLKNFCRPDSSPQPIDVREVLESAINMAMTEVAGRARLIRDYSPVRPVLADGARLGQVFLNLLLNAAQALVDDAVAHEIRITLRPEEAKLVRIDITDTGHGIHPANMQRIFEPFFTTKPPGIGTGLGLSISQSIVHGMKGRLTVESEVGRGSTFCVRLPSTA